VNKKYPHVFQPGMIGSVKLKNRIYKNGTHMFYHNKTDGFMNQRTIDYYEVLARGGVGLVTVSMADIDYPIGVAPGTEFRIDSDEYIPGYARLAEAIHKYDVPAFMQILHLGPMHPGFTTPGIPPVAASTLPKDSQPKPHFDIARALSPSEVEEKIEKFISAAERIKKAGFDGIEINGATAHLINSFLSRAWNKREDEWGGSLENRAKFLLNVIRGIKQRNGKDFAVTALFNAAEVGLKDGITTEEGREIALMIQEAGADALQVRVEYYKFAEDDKRRESTHFPDLYFFPDPPSPLPVKLYTAEHGRGAPLPIAAVIKNIVKIPVMTVGRFDVAMGEKALSSGQLDFFCMNRRLLADPELPRKTEEGREDDITPCTGCNTCFDFGEHGEAVYCQVNASLGREREYEIKAAAKKKKVMVVGGGPSGMEAARIAALRGHEVLLYEKEPKLGGSLPLAAVVKGFDREDILGLISFLRRQMTKHGIKTVLGSEVSAATVERVKPDVLIMATGGTHNIPEVPGINRPNVMTSSALHKMLRKYLRYFEPEMLHALTNIWMPLGRRVAIMGGNLQGCQVAEFLVKRKRRVTIAEPAKEIGEGLVESLVKPFLLNWLIDKGVAMLAGVKYEEITEKGLGLTDREGKKQLIEADSIVTAMPLKPGNDFYKALEDKVPEIYAIGDCRDPHLIIDAIADGSRIGRLI
jgi:2,4-dienoyl-CoA reductase (NADPH2)